MLYLPTSILRDFTLVPWNWLFLGLRYLAVSATLQLCSAYTHPPVSPPPPPRACKHLLVYLSTFC